MTPSLSKRALKLLDRVRAGEWYPWNGPGSGPKAMQELLDAGVVDVGSRSEVNRACYVLAGWTEDQERRDRRQAEMLKWAHETFGGIENFDPCTIQERARRFLEEAIELCQAAGVTEAECRTVSDYVFGRPAGTPAQEIGGVMVTLNCLAEVLGESVARAEAAEWERVQSKSKEHFEARHRAKMEAGL